MLFEYAPRGLVGVLTPQANPTVEPEFGILLPPGMGMLTARLVSKSSSLEQRLADYFNHLNGTIDQFADAPLKAFGVACTGSSYVLGKTKEDAQFEELRQRRKVPIFSTAQAVTLALETLNAHRIGLVSPYPDSLLKLSIAYWESRGFISHAVATVKDTTHHSGSTHPIYGIETRAVIDALNELQDQPLDAIVLLGTGMPSLPAILSAPNLNGTPVISCTLALAWRCAGAVLGQTPTLQSLQEWISGAHWKHRLSL